MIKQTCLALSITAGCALLMSAASISQTTPASPPVRTNPPGLERSRPKTPPTATPRAIIAQDGFETGTPSIDRDTYFRGLEERREKLRVRLADPKQREQLIAERMQGQRELNPDLGRILDLDAKTEDKLLRLLIDQQLARELRDSPVARSGTGRDSLKEDAQNYDQHIAELSTLIGATRLDAYLEYVRTRNSRVRVEQFNASLPAAAKLTNEQKDALLPLLVAEDEQRNEGVDAEMRRLRTDDRFVPETPEQRQRRNQVLNILVNEKIHSNLETANRYILQSLPQILDREQVGIYAQQRSQQLDNLHEHTLRLRREAGIDPHDPLETEAPRFPVLSLDTQLELRLRINGTELTKRVLSARGASVTLTGPQGLLVEARPSLAEANTLSVLLCFYESVRGGRRQVGCSVGQTRPINPDQPPEFVTTNVAVLQQGRKAYVLEWSVKVSYP